MALNVHAYPAFDPDGWTVETDATDGAYVRVTFASPRQQVGILLSPEQAETLAEGLRAALRRFEPVT